MFPLKDSIKIPFAPLTTYFIILINIGVFLYQEALAPRAPMNSRAITRWSPGAISIRGRTSMG
jgi:hypothetical protein